MMVGVITDLRVTLNLRQLKHHHSVFGTDGIFIRMLKTFLLSFIFLPNKVVFRALSGPYQVQYSGKSMKYFMQILPIFGETDLNAE